MPPAGFVVDGDLILDLSVSETSSRSAAPSKCATCEMLQHTPLACQDCHQVLAHVHGADYFELFGLPRSYQIDRGLLAQRYLGISRNIHPDRFAQAGPEMQTFALRMSAAINKAHDVLRDDFLRAEYLLESAGGVSAAEDKRVPGGLLSEVMMIREELDDAGSDREAMDRLAGQVRQRRDQVQASIETLCENLDRADSDAKGELRQQLNAMKYLNNLVDQFSERKAP